MLIYYHCALSNEKVPKEWQRGIIVSIYIGKDDRGEHKHYEG